jgi:hypothetical protein
VSDGGLRALTGFTSSLTSLNLYGCGRVSDDGFRALGGLTARMDGSGRQVGAWDDWCGFGCAAGDAECPGYGDLGQHRLLVFAVDEYGMMSRDAQTLRRECIAVREDRLNVEGRHSTWACRTFSAFWKQCLFVTLARRLVCVILLRAQGDYRRI